MVAAKSAKAVGMASRYRTIVPATLARRIEPRTIPQIVSAFRFDQPASSAVTEHHTENPLNRTARTRQNLYAIITIERYSLSSAMGARAAW